MRLAQVALIILIHDTSYNDAEFVVLFFIYFDIVGKHEHSVPLTYTPWSGKSAVCCNADYIFVAEYYGNVHVHTWTGLYIQKLSLQGHYIHAIQCCHDGTVLQLAGGTHLHAYKVSYIQLQFAHTHRPTGQFPDEEKKIIKKKRLTKRSGAINSWHQVCYPHAGNCKVSCTSITLLLHICMFFQVSLTF